MSHNRLGANQINSQKLIVKIYKVFKEWKICKNRKKIEIFRFSVWDYF